MMRKLILKKIVLCCIVINSFLIITAQEKNDVPKPLSPAVGNGENCLSKVRLNVSVWSRKKGFLNDLTDNSFEVYDEKQKRQIECFAKTDEPVSVGILIDLSGFGSFC